MREVTLDELKEIAENSRVAVWGKANSVGREPRITLHWSAGYYNTLFSDYHISITGDGDIYVSTEDLSEVLSHTWKANSGNVGISLCCGYGATSEDLGGYPPTDKQIEIMAQVIATVANGLWLSIDKDHIATHGEIADDISVYDEEDLHGPENGCERWDLQYLGTDESPYYTSDHNNPITGGNVLRGKAQFYREQWKNEVG